MSAVVKDFSIIILVSSFSVLQVLYFCLSFISKKKERSTMSPVKRSTKRGPQNCWENKRCESHAQYLKIWNRRSLGNWRSINRSDREAWWACLNIYCVPETSYFAHCRHQQAFVNTVKRKKKLTLKRLFLYTIGG